MTLSDFEIGKIAEIVAGKSGTKLDAKALRQVIDRVVDQLNEQRGNPEIEGVTCEVSRPSSEDSRGGLSSNLPNKAGSKTDPPYKTSPSGAPQLAVGSELGAPSRQGGTVGSEQKPSAPSCHSGEGQNPEGQAIEGPVSSLPPDPGALQLAVGSSLPPPDETLIESEGGLYEQIEKSDKTRVIVATFGKNRPGVVAALTQVLAEYNCSIEDISQTLLQDFFSMIMIVNIEGSTVDFSTLCDHIKATESQLGMKVYVMHEDIFRYMHRI